MLNEDNSTAKQIGVAVAIAALSTLASGLVTWGIEELKNRLKNSNEKSNQD